MRYDKGDIVLIQSVALCNKSTIVAHARYGITEHCASLLIEVMQTMVNSEMRRSANRTSCLDMQEGQTLTISTEMSIHNTDVLFFCSFHEYCRCTISEKSA